MAWWGRRAVQPSSEPFWALLGTPDPEQWRAAIAHHGVRAITWQERPAPASEGPPCHRPWSVGPLRWTLWFVQEPQVRRVALSAWLNAGACPMLDAAASIGLPRPGWPAPAKQGPPPPIHGPVDDPLWCLVRSEEEEDLLVSHAPREWGLVSDPKGLARSSMALTYARGLGWVGRLMSSCSPQVLADRIWHPEAGAGLLEGTRHLLEQGCGWVDSDLWYIWASHWCRLSQPLPSRPSSTMPSRFASFDPYAPPKGESTPASRLSLGRVLVRHDTHAADHLLTAWLHLIAHSHNLASRPLREALPQPEAVGKAMVELVGHPTSWKPALDALHRQPNLIALRFLLAWGLPPDSTREGYGLAHRWCALTDSMGLDGLDALLAAGSDGRPDASTRTLSQWFEDVWMQSVWSPDLYPRFGLMRTRLQALDTHRLLDETLGPPLVSRHRSRL